MASRQRDSRAPQSPPADSGEIADADLVVTHAKYAERIALAVVNGEVSMEDARDDLHLHLLAAQVDWDARALRDFREGRPVWAWPAHTPWVGF